VTAVVSVAVYVVLSRRGADGSKVTIAPLTENVPTTLSTPSLRMNDVAVTLPERIGSLNVAVTLVPTATPVALLSGLVGGLTMGGVVSGAAFTVRLTVRVVFPVPLVEFVKVTVSL
jgi:hypothetical protein